MERIGPRLSADSPPKEKCSGYSMFVFFIHTVHSFRFCDAHFSLGGDAHIRVDAGGMRARASFSRDLGLNST
jgi:hypothetical protein